MAQSNGKLLISMSIMHTSSSSDCSTYLKDPKTTGSQVGLKGESPVELFKTTNPAEFHQNPWGWWLRLGDFWKLLGRVMYLEGWVSPTEIGVDVLEDHVGLRHWLAVTSVSWNVVGKGGKKKSFGKPQVFLINPFGLNSILFSEELKCTFHLLCIISFLSQMSLWRW